MPLVYETDSRGRSGVYREAHEPAEAMRVPKAPLPSQAYDTEERADGLHLVNVETGQSFGIMATPEIAADQLSALRRMTS